MRKIEAIVRKSKFKEVKKALISSGFNAFNYHLTRCISKKSEKRFYRGISFDSKAKERIVLSLYVKDKNVDTAVEIIKNAGNTREADDSYLLIFAANRSYMMKGENGNDKLIELI